MSDTPDRVKKIVVEHLGVEEDKVTPDASFIDDLGADSLDIVELVMAFEEEFGVEIPDDAAGQAIEDAGLTEMSEQERFRAGVSIGSGIGGLPGIEAESLVLHEKGPRRVSPHFVHGRLINLISGQVSIKYGLMGPNHAVVTACSTGAHSIGDAARMIAMDDADVMLAGGSPPMPEPIEQPARSLVASSMSRRPASSMA